MKHPPLLILFIFTICNFSPVLGQILKSKTYIFHYKNGNYINKKETFDRSGNLISEVDCLDEKCIKKDADIYIYNNLNQLIEDSVYTTKWGHFHLIWRTVYTYYDNGKLKTETRINDDCKDNYDEELTYYYDQHGKVLRIMTKHACDDKSYFNYPVYLLYNSNGNKISKTAMNRDTNKVFYKYIYTYDKQNNLIRDDYYFAEKDSLSLSSSRCYEYNINNKLISLTWIFSFGRGDSTSYNYYKNGLLKEEHYFSKINESKRHWIKYFYNKKGNIKAIQHYYLDKKRKRKGKKEVFKYEYYE